MRRRIFMEVGHSSGPDRGAISYSGRSEFEYNKEVVEGVNKALFNLIKFRNPDYLPEHTNYESYRNAQRDFSSSNAAPVLIDDDRWGLQQTIDRINSVAKPEDFILSVHFNAGSNLATGSEIFIFERSSLANKNRASTIVSATANCLGIGVRKGRSRNLYKYDTEAAVGSLGIIRRTRCPAALLEVCFLNERDLLRYETGKHCLFNSLAQILYSDIF